MKGSNYIEVLHRKSVYTLCMIIHYALANLQGIPLQMNETDHFLAVWYM